MSGFRVPYRGSKRAVFLCAILMPAQPTSTGVVGHGEMTLRVHASHVQACRGGHYLAGIDVEENADMLEDILPEPPIDRWYDPLASARASAEFAYRLASDVYPDLSPVDAMFRL